MYGTGFRGALEGDAAWFADALADWGGAVISVDIPSGVDGLTGAACGTAVRAGSTVTFAARKPGLSFEPGRSCAGEVQVAEIGIDLGPDGAAPGGGWPPIAILDAADVARLLPSRRPTAHKWVSGVMVVGGSGGMTGAPLLASHGALRSGAGMVFCGLPGADAARHASGTEVITRPLPATHDDALATEAVDAVLHDIERFRALAVGPGLGSHEATQHAVRALVAARTRSPLVLDADGLNACSGDPELFRARPTTATPRSSPRTTASTPA